MPVKEADMKDTGCDSTDGKRPEQADPHIYKVGSWVAVELGRDGVT